MAQSAKYYLAVRPGAAVGPHKLDSLREWAECGAIGAEWQVCKEGESAWIAISEIPRFHEYPKQLRERLDRFRRQAHEVWRSDAPTEKQLVKLRFFEIPFSEASLTKGRASELIDAFMGIDPERETQYRNQPATVAQAKQIRALGGDPTGLTYSKAGYLIDELIGEKDDREFESAINFEILDDMLNDEDVREICGYRKLTKSQVTQMLDHLTAHLPGWEKKSRFDLGGLVLEVFPDQRRAASRSASPQTIASIRHPPVARAARSKSPSSLVGAAVLVGLLAVGVFYKVSEHSASHADHVPEATPPPATNAPPASVAPPTEAIYQTALAASKKRALAAHPQLGVAGSPLNRAFLAGHDKMVKSGDVRLSKPDWPERLADECAASP